MKHTHYMNIYTQPIELSEQLNIELRLKVIY